MSHAHSDEGHSNTLFGFWLYLLTDFVMFASIFATYVVLQYGNCQGACGKELFNLPLALVQTLLLTACSFLTGLSSITTARKHRVSTLVLWGLSFVGGALFLWLEYKGMEALVVAGHTWKENAFLSAFFTLLVTHAAHMVFALLWVLVLCPVVFFKGFDAVVVRRLSCLRMFWQFLTIVWVFIFTVVYLLGVV